MPLASSAAHMASAVDLSLWNNDERRGPSFNAFLIRPSVSAVFGCGPHGTTVWRQGWSRDPPRR
jgi:hypothetical protein